MRIQNFSGLAEIVTDQGYAIVLGVLDERQISLLLDALSDLELPRSRAGIRHVLGHPAVSAVANDARLLGIVQAVLGSAAFPFRATLFDKSPDSNWLIAWHQDTALPLREKRETPGWGPWSIKDGVIYAHAPATALNKVVALRLSLDDSTDENGPLRVLSGSHSKGVFTDDQVEQLVREGSPVTCTVAKGGILVMRPLLIHASSKSRVEAKRRVLHIEYAASMDISGGIRLAVA